MQRKKNYADEATVEECCKAHPDWHPGAVVATCREAADFKLANALVHWFDRFEINLGSKRNTRAVAHGIIRELRARFDCFSRGGEAPQDGGAEKV
jgi:hypothetical protein